MTTNGSLLGSLFLQSILAGGLFRDTAAVFAATAKAVGWLQRWRLQACKNLMMSVLWGEQNDATRLECKY